MTQTFKPNINNYKVLTPDGFKPFAGIDIMGSSPLVRLEFEQDMWIECTHDHKLYVNNTEHCAAALFEIGHTVLSCRGPLKLLNKIELPAPETVYDLVEVADGHRFYANGIVSSNCEFIIFDETLINSLKLAEMFGVEPMLKAGQVRYYRPIDGTKTFVLAWDPSLGTGGDNAAVQVLQLPEMTQVAEWQHNKTDIKGQLKIIRDIIAYIDHEIKQQKNKGEIYWSVENNSIGEAALMAIREMGEENIPGTFLTEPGKQRRGFTTTFKVKISACAKLKYWVENDKIALLSKNLIRELKNFIASGQSFAAKQGETDDLVMATVLCVRMIQQLVNWDQNLFEKLQDDAEKADIVMPMPIGML